MKQAISIIITVLICTSLWTFRFVYNRWPWEPEHILPTNSTELPDIGNTTYTEGYLEFRDGLNLDQDYTIEFSVDYSKMYITATQIKTICIKHLDATRCADSLLLWELILKMEETK